MIFYRKYLRISFFFLLVCTIYGKTNLCKPCLLSLNLNNKLYN